MAEHAEGGEVRPDPDALLRRVAAEEARAGLGRLKIFFGYAPGVGKTYAMLESARRLRAEGVDVVIGCVETHGRAETARLLEGLEVLPRREVVRAGARFDEFDLDAALARRPSVLLLDELAHTNAHGSRHVRRWDDACELLDAGIGVHTTLNVQHLEGLNDIVAQITSVRVRETVPEAVIARAEEIELVDLSPEELLERLREGRVYVPEQIERAATHFFRRGNLLALRELALRRAAERVDHDIRSYREEHAIRETWPAAEHILACIGPSPGSARLARAAARMAAGLRAPWTAAWVDAAGLSLSAADATRLEANLALAERLGAQVMRMQGERVAPTLLGWARRRNVTRVVIGKPTHPRWRDRLRGSLLDEIVRGSGDIEVHVIAGEVGPSDSRVSERGRRAPPRAYAIALLQAAVATAIGVLWRTHLALPDVVMLYLVGIVLVAVRFGRGPSVAASAVSVAAYDFFFVPPYHTFSVSEIRNVLTFTMMFGAGLLLSSLTLRLRRQELAARDREARTAGLYALSRELGAAIDTPRIAAVIAGRAADALGGGAIVLLPDGSEGLREAARHGSANPLDEHEQAVARWTLDHGRPAGLGTGTVPGSAHLMLPLASGPRTHGVLAALTADGRPPDAEQRQILDAFCRQAALALERARLAQEAREAELRAHAEELRASLLSAVSHDLRTPLATIKMAAAALRPAPDAVGAGERGPLAEAILGEADRLERLVGNLLDMTRVEAGNLEVKREWVPLEEIVGSATARLEGLLGRRPLRIDLPTGLPLVAADPILLEQVFVNLIENAVRHAPGDTPIDITARESATGLAIEVGDRGPGLPAGQEARIFDKFFRAGAGKPAGAGLGLAICRGIVEAHGGTIAAANRQDGGALFSLTLPVPNDTPRPPLEFPEDAP